MSYIVLRLADDSFVHVSFHNHTDDEVNPISSTAAFAHFQDGHADRREGGVDQQTASLVGSYITTIELSIAQSGRSGTEGPRSRPRSTARVTAAEPNRRPISSSAASRAPSA